MSIIVPTQDLAPSVTSRIVTIRVTDLPEGGILEGKSPGTVTFMLPGDLRVPADDIIIRAGAVEVPLAEDGTGQVRLPVHDPDAIADGLGSDWYLLVSKSWTQQVDMIRVPPGTGSISLADLPPVVEVNPGMAMWLLTSASVELVEGASWGVTVTTSGGIARFRFTVPPAGTAFWRGASPLLGTADLAALEAGQYTVWSSSVASSLALPTSDQGVLEVARWGTEGRIQVWRPRPTVNPIPQVWQRHYLTSSWAPWTRVDAAESTWWRGTVATTDPAALNDLAALPAVRTVWSSAIASAAGLPTVTQGIHEHFRYGNTGAVQRWTTRPSVGASEIWTRHSTPAGDAWDNWYRVGDGGGSGGAGGSGFKTVPLAVTVGNNGSVDAAASGLVRYALHLNAPITRWRLHVANRNARTGAIRPGAVVFTDWQLGKEGTAGALTAPITALRGATIDGSGWVSEWTTAPIGTGEALLLATSYTSDVAPYAQVGTAWVGATEGALTRATTAPFEVWIEAETPATTPVVAVLGSSSDAGVGGARPVVDSVLAVWARAARALPVHYAHSGDDMASSLDQSAHKWTRWAHLARPDSVLFSLGSNDVYIGATLEELQARHAAVAAIASTVVSPVQYGANIFRRASGEATNRVAYNTWLATQPNGLRDIFDFSAAIGSPPNAAFNADGVHLNDAGQAALLGTITRPLTAALSSGADATVAFNAYLAEIGA